VGVSAGLLRRKNGTLRIAACSLFVLNASLIVVLGLRPGGGDLGFTVVFAIVAALLVILGWRKRLLGGAVLLLGGALFTVGGLFGSATYEGEAAGLLFDEDTFYTVSLGLVPFLCGVLLILSRIASSAGSDVAVATHSSSR
jgi:hypothetical protein